VALCVLVMGRAVEVLYYEWPYYRAHPLHVLHYWRGGMSSHGLLLGGCLGTWLFCRLRRRPFLALADELTIPGAFLLAVGRLGNFVDGQIVGSPTDVWWAVKFPDAEGFRHPVVLYDGLKNVLLVPLLLLIRRRARTPGGSWPTSSSGTAPAGSSWTSSARTRRASSGSAPGSSSTWRRRRAAWRFSAASAAGAGRPRRPATPRSGGPGPAWSRGEWRSPSWSRSRW
jgi:hypothetical protein